MNLNKKIGVLLDNGFKPEFISSLNESKINFLFEKVSSKKETKEQTASPNVQKINIPASTGYRVPSGGEVSVGGVDIKNTGGVTTVTPTTAKQVTETEEVDEKFESKAQQGLFWARCNKCKTDDCKWCKMAKEFSKSTSKKQYKTMPEKKHPEKTVKYKKKETKEEFTMANYLDKVGSTYTNIAKSKLTKEQFIKNQINKIVENNLQPTMKKRDLLRLIESESKKRKNLNEDFYYDEMDEDFDMMSKYEGEPNWYEEDEEDYEEYEIPPGKERPSIAPGREDDDAPRPRNKMSRLSRRMNDPAIIEPIIKPKPKEPDVEPEWTPDKDEPNIDPGTNPNPMGRPKKPNINSFKRDFNRVMSRMDESNYKPIKYRKY